MLVLRRKVGESIILSGMISISVLAVEGERVKIGISAPADVTIVREELLRVLSNTDANATTPTH
jgi:carbon storage regulator